MFITGACVLFFIKLRWPKNKSLYDISIFFDFSKKQTLMVPHSALASNGTELFFDNRHIVLKYNLKTHFPTSIAWGWGCYFVNIQLISSSSLLIH